MNQSDRDTQFALQLTSKEKSNRREGTHRFGIRRLPLPLNVSLRLVGHLMSHTKEPDLWQVGGGLGLGTAQVAVVPIALSHGPLHIGLTGAEPDFAHQYIANRHLAGALNRELMRSDILGNRQ